MSGVLVGGVVAPDQLARKDEGARRRTSRRYASGTRLSPSSSGARPRMYVVWKPWEKPRSISART